jgi:hypothetical protein
MKTDLTDSDFPSFSQTNPVDMKKAAPKKEKEGKWTKIQVSKGSNGNKSPVGNADLNATSSKAFPGQWAPSIGGSGGNLKKGGSGGFNAAPSIDAADFPSFSSAASNGTASKSSSSQKVKKYSKNNFIKLS